MWSWEAIGLIGGMSWGSTASYYKLVNQGNKHRLGGLHSTNISTPFLHIENATAQQLHQDNITKVGLSGTRFTMKQDFYKNRLINNFNIDVIVPDSDQQTIIHDVI